jgi:site-specific DNA-cytosine methylase
VCETYEELAVKYDYSIHYIMLNAVSFAVPQWRPRMWAIFHSRHELGEARNEEFMVDLSPHYLTIGDVLDPVGTEHQLGSGIEKGWQNVKPYVERDWYGNILRVAQEKLNIEPAINYANVRSRFQINGFASNAPWLLDPDWFAPVITSASRLYDFKRHLTIEEYCDIAGFPRDYRWGNRKSRFREYLSKGVAPPVAAWVLQTALKNLNGWEGPFTHRATEFGEVIDIRPTKPEVRNALKQGGKVACRIA